MDQERLRYRAGRNPVRSAHPGDRDHLPSCGLRFSGPGLFLPVPDRSGETALPDLQVPDDGGRGGGEA